MKIRLAHVLAVCVAGAFAQSPAGNKLPDSHQRALEGLKQMRLLDKPLPQSPPPVQRFRQMILPENPALPHQPKVERTPVCSIPLINVLPQVKTAPMPQHKPGGRFYMREAAVPAPPCEDSWRNR
jgi:hypothetical protein